MEALNSGEESEDFQGAEYAGPPALVYVLAQNAYAAWQNGAWQMSQPMVKTAAQVYLETRILPTIMAHVRSPKLLKRLEDVKDLARHPLVETVDGFDCIPHGGRICRVGDRVIANAWRAPTVPAIQGDWPNLLRLLRYQTANVDGTPDDDAMDWFVTWMGAKVQNPGSTLLTSPVIHGPQGNGKNTACIAFMQALGRDNCVIVTQDSLESSFNSEYAGKLGVFADDCIPRGSMRDLSGKLKTSITGERILLNPKHVQAIEVPNRAVWWFTSNSEHPVVLEPADRRHSVFSNRIPVTPEHRAFLRSFWNPRVKNEPSEWFWREISAFRWFLENGEVDYDLISVPYENAARAVLIDINRSSEDAFKVECEERGFVTVMSEVFETSGEDRAPGPVGLAKVNPAARTKGTAVGREFRSQDVFDVYKRWCKRRNRHLATHTALSLRLKGEPSPWEWRKSSDVIFTVPAGGQQ